MEYVKHLSKLRAAALPAGRAWHGLFSTTVLLRRNALIDVGILLSYMHASPALEYGQGISSQQGDCPHTSG